MHYVIAGSGYPLVLLHGWPESCYEWRKITPSLAERFTVIAPDLRGLGNSDRPMGGYDKRIIDQGVFKLRRLLLDPSKSKDEHDLGFRDEWLESDPARYRYIATYQEIGDTTQQIIMVAILERF